MGPMRLKSWASNGIVALSFLLGLGLIGGARVQTQSPFLVFGSSSGSSQVIKATSNALWVAIQGGPIAGQINPDSICLDSTNKDVCLVRDAANTLALRNGTNPQLFKIYNTFTDATHNEFLEVGLTSLGANDMGILTNQGSAGGTSRNLFLGTNGTSSGINFMINGLNVWSLGSNGNWSDQGSHSITAGSTISGTKHISATAAPGLSTCGTGSIDANSNDFAGKVTATGATACTVTFTSAYPTAAWCVISDDTTVGVGKITAQSSSAFTVSNLTSGDAFNYVCGGK